MRTILCLTLVAIFAVACVSDEEGTPVFVTDVTLPSGGQFAPGDRMTVAAQGLRQDDDLLLGIAWPMQNELSDKGTALGVYAVIVGRSATEIAFLAPGGYPASEVEVLLLRGGRTQSLGTFELADGQAPEEYSLYGIAHSDAHCTVIERLDQSTGTPTPVAQLPGSDALHCAVNAPGSNRIYGLTVREGDGPGVFYDLTMRYWRDSDPNRYVAVGTLGSEVAYLRCVDNTLYLTKMSRTRTSPVVTPSWTLPEGLTVDMLTATPFVFDGNGALLLAADNGDGTLSPVVLFPHAEGYRVAVGAPVRASALIAFHTVRSVEVGGTIRNHPVGGYAIAADDGSASELQLFDSASLSFEEPFATLAGPVVSIAVDRESEHQKIYCLTETIQGTGEIHVFDQLHNEWAGKCSLPGDRIPYSQIVLAR